MRQYRLYQYCVYIFLLLAQLCVFCYLGKDFSFYLLKERFNSTYTSSLFLCFFNVHVNIVQLTQCVSLAFGICGFGLELTFFLLCLFENKYQNTYPVSTFS